MVVGGGRVAERKIQTLLAAGGSVYVWAEKISDGIQDLERTGKIVVVDAAIPVAEFIKHAFLVVCATDDRELHQEIGRKCRELHIPINSATDSFLEGEEEGDSTFIFPSVVQRSGLCIGIGVHPAVPSLSKQVRREVEEDVPTWYGELAERLATLRMQLRRQEPAQERRSHIMGRLTEYGLDHEGKIPDAIFQEIVEKERIVQEGQRYEEKREAEEKEVQEGESYESRDQDRN